jgi:hypothetical protein
MHGTLRPALLISMALILGGCFDELDDDDRRGQIDDNPSSANQAPTIAGSPPTRIVAGELYEFAPTANDPEGDTLEFAVARKPSWANFDRATGRLWGVPGAEDVGNFTNIGISVSDGHASVSLLAFDISVDQIAAGSATISWTPPTENADGTVLTDLAGYRSYYGRDRDYLNHVVQLSNPGLTRYVIENLTAARWFFSMTSVNAEGVESLRSAIAAKDIG